jgi:hypothetical protein
MDFGAILSGIAEASRSVPTAPKWLRGKTVCPLMIGDALFWRTEQLIVRGIPPVGVTYSHDEPHILPESFGPIGEGKQVVPGPPYLSGATPLQTEMGETLTFVPTRAIKFVHRFIVPTYFAHPPVDDTPQLIVVYQSSFDRDEDGEQRRTFRSWAFLAPAMQNNKHFLLPEERERLPQYTGTLFSGDDGDHGIDMFMSSYDQT